MKFLLGYIVGGLLCSSVLITMIRRGDLNV